MPEGLAGAKEFTDDNSPGATQQLDTSNNLEAYLKMQEEETLS